MTAMSLPLFASARRKCLSLSSYWPAFPSELA